MKKNKLETKNVSPVWCVLMRQPHRVEGTGLKEGCGVMHEPTQRQWGLTAPALPGTQDGRHGERLKNWEEEYSAQ